MRKCLVKKITLSKAVDLQPTTLPKINLLHKHFQGCCLRFRKTHLEEHLRLIYFRDSDNL